MLVSAETDCERQLATKALWTLAFDEDNKIIYSNSFCLEKLRKMAQSDNTDLQKTAAGVLWEIEGKQKHFHSSGIFYIVCSLFCIAGGKGGERLWLETCKGGITSALAMSRYVLRSMKVSL